jgi:catechol 2,3-dioxygenase-like lactoylglutathione lyase family enzyme
MRLRTVYFKVARLAEVCAWWEAFLGVKPVKASASWVEFRVGEVNLGFLRVAGARAGGAEAPCVPVLEFADREAARRIARAKELGARPILEGQDHPDYPNTAAVLVDPFGSQFEITNLRD